MQSGANQDGEAFFYEHFMGSGPQGSGVYEQGSFTDGQSAHYFDDWSHVSGEGAVTGFTHSGSDNENWNDYVAANGDDNGDANGDDNGDDNGHDHGDDNGDDEENGHGD